MAATAQQSRAAHVSRPLLAATAHVSVAVGCYWLLLRRCRAHDSRPLLAASVASWLSSHIVYRLYANYPTGMILTLYYMYATFLQWWRLGTLRNKLRGTLNHQNALVVSNSLNLYDVRDHRSLENLLFQNGDRVVCTIVPKVSLLYAMISVCLNWFCSKRLIWRLSGLVFQNMGSIFRFSCATLN